MIGGPRSYPKQIVVGDQIWDVKFVKTNSFSKLEEGLLGMADPSDRVILIRMGQSKEETLSTFLHEVMHCFEFEGEFKGCPNMYHKFIFETEGWWAKFLADNCTALVDLLLTLQPDCKIASYAPPKVRQIAAKKSSNKPRKQAAARRRVR